MPVILFAGAPTGIRAEACVLEHFSDPFTKLLGLDRLEQVEAEHDDGSQAQPQDESGEGDEAGGQGGVAWRCVPPPHRDFIFQGAQEDALTRIYESAYDPPPSSSSSPSRQETTLSTDFTTTLADTTGIQAAGDAQAGPDLHLVSLAGIPPHSSSSTINAVVAILSIAPPRSVTTRWGSRTSLIELLVGDPTLPSFPITLWLSPPAAPPDLQRQDVILFTNLGLRVFRGQVHGQNLRGTTRIDLLWRRGQKSHQRGGGEKASEVRDWVLRFVGGRDTWDRPPDDTQI